MRIIVCGLVAQYPLGGVAWDYLQYMIGFCKLGHDVYYYEDTWSWPYHPCEKRNTSDGEYSANYIGRFIDRYAPELKHRWHYFHLHQISYGMTRRSFDKIARSADLFVNVSGASIIPDTLSPHCIKVFLDTDPGYNQIMLVEKHPWSENIQRWCASVRSHDQHFTYAENIHGSNCLIPKAGLHWKTTRMPVVIPLWEQGSEAAEYGRSPWSTIMTWNAFKGKLEYRGIEYKSKGREFEQLLDLPEHVTPTLKVALGGIDAPLQRLLQHGWKVVDGPEATLTPEQYQSFIADSRGEISPAKHVYVAMNSGWFSCRSACYLAAGKPVVVQDTGFSNHFTCGKGIMPFRTAQEAVEAIREVEADYQAHARIAKSVAFEYLDANKVLNDFIEQVNQSVSADTEG